MYSESNEGFKRVKLGYISRDRVSYMVTVDLTWYTY